MTPVPTVPLLAHGGPGASWQALVVLVSLGVAALVVAAAVGRLRLREGADLVVPLAGVAIVASIAPVFSTVLSDAVSWALPVGIVALTSLVLATFTRLRLTPTSALTIGTVVVAVAGVVTLQPTLARVLHGPVDALPDGTGIALRIGDGAGAPDTVSAGSVEVPFVLTGGTVAAEEPAGTPEDPAHGGRLNVFLDGTQVPADPPPACTLLVGCTTQVVTIEVEPGEHRLVAEFVGAGGLPFSPPVIASWEFEAT